MSEPRARLFVALELPGAVRTSLVGWRSTASGDLEGLRPLAPEALHLTLCFLGWHPAGEIEAIGTACGIVAPGRAVELSLGDCAWLPARRPRVLAVQLRDATAQLARLQSALSDALRRGGWYAPEPRRFLAHVTVARVAKGGPVRRWHLPPPPELAFRGSVVTLYRSAPGPGGARYERQRSIGLGA